ncbi:peptidylprolyl isomerase [Mucilaginibacter sp. FT3.2]|uniref:peptidylprolyl isomerase n=1 Tax=Mucilaginibacter sp. FT3.2 TaxID=2723090 RepID=UPI0017AE2BC0|nr:peptidylprolyl isomerase [Mucilaginibacter sp. FT3.2]MBB6231230.1 peptidyl-prolyl cis-trans isomerase B (cyclophilin B) [Mucilaginibacter sp. FT3.2]
MKKTLFLLAALVLIVVNGFAQQANRYVKIETPQGWCIVKLYNETPLHRDNFIKLVKSGYFNTTTFNRILKNFVIQGGDPDSLYEKTHVLKQEQKWLPAEFDANLYHKRGVLAMGRDANAAQASFTTQIYIVDGKKWTGEQLDAIEKKYNLHFNEAQRQVYQTVGGTPFLDQHYTVFGEIVKGIDLIDKITALKVDKNGNPDSLVWMKLTLLKPGEVAKALK